MDELKTLSQTVLDGGTPTSEVLPHSLAFNLFLHNSPLQENSYCEEEMKMVNETRKIMGLPDLRFSATCVRVPVLRAHSISVSASFERPVSIEAAREAIADFGGAELVDEPAEAAYPMPLDYSETVACGVGRIRLDRVLDNGLSLWVCGDQLWKGAALNAIQIAELLHERGRLGQ